MNAKSLLTGCNFRSFGVLKKSESESESELARTNTLDFFPQNSLTHSHFLTEGCNFCFEESEFFVRVATRNNHFYMDYDLL
jgi:hypothetical protein